MPAAVRAFYRFTSTRIRSSLAFVSRTTLRDRLIFCAHRAAARLGSELRDDGSFGPGHQGLVSYTKSASLFLAAGRWDLADRVLGLVADRFLQEGGSLAAGGEGEPPDPMLSAHPGYANGWVAMAAQRLGRFEISEPVWGHLRGFFHPELGGCCVEGPYDPGAARHVDMLMTAHLGMCALFFGDGEIAQRAEQLLVRFLDQQPEPGRLLLRMDGHGELLRPDASPLAMQIEAAASAQPWYAVGYPVGFLGLLHRVTTSGEALRAARGYLDFALACPALPGEQSAHVVAWAAGILGAITQSPRYFDLSVVIARSLMAAQRASGLWREVEDQPPACFDQSAETALWLLEVARVAAIADRPERSRAEVTSTTWRRGVGAWSLRGRTGGDI
jgi:hypothetical protein